MEEDHLLAEQSSSERNYLRRIGEILFKGRSWGNFITNNQASKRVNRPNPNINKVSELLILEASTYIDRTYPDIRSYPTSATPFLSSIEYIWENKLYNAKFLKYFMKVFRFCKVKIPEIDVTTAIEFIKSKADNYLVLDKDLANEPKIIEHVAKFCYTKLIDHPLVPFKPEYINLLDNRWTVQRLLNSAKMKEIDEPLKYQIYLQAIRNTAINITAVDVVYHTEEMINAALIHQGRNTIYHMRDSLTYEQWLLTIKNCPTLFSYVPKEHHTEEMLNIAIKCGENIQFMEQTPERVLECIRAYGSNIRYIKEQTEELCYEAAKTGTNWSTVFFCKILTPRVVAAALINHRSYNYTNLMQCGLPQELHYTKGYYLKEPDPRANQIRWWIMREHLFQIGLVFHENIYLTLWITDFMEFFELGLFTEYIKIKVLQAIEKHKRIRGMRL